MPTILLIATLVNLLLLLLVLAGATTERRQRSSRASLRRRLNALVRYQVAVRSISYWTRLRRMPGAPLPRPPPPPPRARLERQVEGQRDELAKRERP